MSQDKAGRPTKRQIAAAKKKCSDPSFQLMVKLHTFMQLTYPNKPERLRIYKKLGWIK